MIGRRVARVLVRLGRRLHELDDAAARSRGLQVRTGHYGLGRRYHDPRWTGRPGGPDRTTTVSSAR